jgi:hypothetical protein
VSLEDSVQVIMQSLSEATETCYITNFQLEVDDKRVDEYTSLSEVPNLHSNTTFVMVEGTSTLLVIRNAVGSPI